MARDQKLQLLVEPKTPPTTYLNKNISTTFSLSLWKTNGNGASVNFILNYDAINVVKLTFKDLEMLQFISLLNGDHIYLIDLFYAASTKISYPNFIFATS